MYRIDVLLKQNRHLFHTRDLALLWNITNNNTLYTTIKRYKAKGILFAVQKGLIYEDLNYLLEPSKFQAIRKTLKSETLQFINDIKD